MYFQNNIRHLFFSFNQTNNVKNTSPMDSSMRLNELKKNTTNTSTSNSVKKVNVNDANSALRRARSSGYIVPAKTQNKFLS